MNNYNNYSKGKKRREFIPKPEVVKDDICVEAKVDNDIPEGCIYVSANVETIEPKIEPKKVEPIIGIVGGCKKLNIRAEPCGDADVISVIDVDKEVIIDLEKSTEDWYGVCTASGVEGYCMKKFITIK